MKASSSFSSDDVNKDSQGGQAVFFSNFVTRQFGVNIYGLQLSAANVGDIPSVVKFKSTDSGANFAHDTSALGATDDTFIAIDVTEISGTAWWVVVFVDDSAGTFTVQAINFDDSSIITGNTIKNANAAYAGGLNSDGDYEYLEFGTDDKFYKVIFEGTGFTRTEITDELVAPDTWDLSRQLYWDFRDRHIILTGNQMFRKLGGVWTLTSVAVEQDVVSVIWKKDNSDDYTFDYVIWNDELYFFNPKGSIIRIQTLVVDARVGYDDWFSTGSTIHQRTNSALIMNKGFISKEKIGFRILTFESPEDVFVKGDGIVLVESDGTELFMGNIASVTTIGGTQSQFITAFSPEKDDLEKEILENFGTVDELAILTLLYANHFEFYYAGTIDDTGNTQTLPSSIRNAHGILKDLEPFGARVIYNELDGKQFYDEADEVALNVKLNTKTEVGVNDWGESGDPDGWTVTEPADTSVEVVPEKDGHTFPVKITDTGANFARIEAPTFASQTSGIVDFWIYTKNVATTGAIDFRLVQTSGATIGLWIGIAQTNAGKLQYRNGAGTWVDITDIVVDTWYHISLDFDNATDTFDIYVNDNLEDSGLAYRNVVTSFEEFMVTTQSTAAEIYFDSIGFSWDNYIQFSNFKIVLTDANSRIFDGGILERGQEINAVVVKGGVDPNLPTDQEVPVGIAREPGVSQQQLVPAIYNIPGLTTQAEVDVRAALILASGPSALIVYKIQYFGDGLNRPAIPQIGRTVDLTNTTHSLTNEILIVQSWRYSLDNNSIVLFATNGLLFLTNNETQDVMNVNTERIFQLARIVAARTIPGLVFYLDNNASDIGGYKKMLDTYAGDALVTFTNTNAVDGEAIEEFATEPNEPGITLLDDGEYDVHLHAKNTQTGSKQARIYFELYKRTIAPAETLLATSEFSNLLTVVDTEFNFHVHISSTEILATDRLVVKLIISVTGSGAGPDIITTIQGTGGTVTSARFTMPSSSQVIANKVNKSGDTMTGALTMATGIDILAAANKTSDIGTVALAFDTMYADDFTNVASERKYTVPSDEEIYQELKNGVEPYITPIIIRDKPHHTRSISHNLDYLNGVIRKLISKIEDLKKIIMG